MTASASGVDPDISLAAAHFQVARISKERGLSQQSIRNSSINIAKKIGFQTDFMSMFCS